MNRIGKRIAGVMLAALIGLGFLIWRGAAPRERMEGHTEETAPVEADKTGRRRPRKGPRKPPVVSPKPSAPSAVPIDEEEPAEEEDPEGPTYDDEDLTGKERKLREYIEHLEAIDDPSVAELTMLGEMAFDANEPDAAYEHYLEVIENHADDPLAPFALYKLAWAEYNLGDVEAAINDMELMIEWTGDGEIQLHETLRSQAPEDLELFGTQAD